MTEHLQHPRLPHAAGQGFGAASPAAGTAPRCTAPRRAAPCRAVAAARPLRRAERLSAAGLLSAWSAATSQGALRSRD